MPQAGDLPPLAAKSGYEEYLPPHAAEPRNCIGSRRNSMHYPISPATGKGCNSDRSY